MVRVGVGAEKRRFTFLTVASVMPHAAGALLPSGLLGVTGRGLVSVGFLAGFSGLSARAAGRREARREPHADPRDSLLSHRE